MSSYKDSEWKTFRESVLQLDGYKCRQCGRGKDEVILQVHHKEYKPGLRFSTCSGACRGTDKKQSLQSARGRCIGTPAIRPLNQSLSPATTACAYQNNKNYAGRNALQTLKPAHPHQPGSKLNFRHGRVAVS